MLEQMLMHAPVYLHKLAGFYRCVWSPSVDGVLVHGLGMSDTPGGAIGRARLDAEAKGWKL
jgi:hypothetical protein